MATTTMTLGAQQKTMASLMQPTSGAACVIVSTQTDATGAGGMASASAAPTASADMLRCKRRINFAHSTQQLSYASQHHHHQHHHQPTSVARRNARERNRVKQVNNGFATLRQHIPVSVAAALSSPTSAGSGGRNASKKLSKVETLRLAVEYIRSLQQLLEEHESGDSTSAATPATTSDNSYYSSSPEASYPPLQTPCSDASSASSPYQHDNYDVYEPMSPEDEELLDVISWWQQSQ